MTKREMVKLQIAAQFFSGQLEKITVWKTDVLGDDEEGFDATKLSRFCADCAEELLSACGIELEESE